MYCNKCGKQIDDKAVICVHCGNQVQKKAKEQEDGKNAFLWGAFAFFIPIAGVIMWAMCKDKQPKNAKAAGIGAVASVATSVLITLIGIIGGAILSLLGVLGSVIASIAVAFSTFGVDLLEVLLPYIMSGG